MSAFGRQPLLGMQAEDLNLWIDSGNLTLCHGLDDPLDTPFDIEMGLFYYRGGVLPTIR